MRWVRYFLITFAVLVAVLVVGVLGRGGYLMFVIDGPRVANWCQPDEVEESLQSDELADPEWLATLEEVTEEEINVSNSDELSNFAFTHLPFSSNTRIVFETRADDPDHVFVVFGEDNKATRLTLSGVTHVQCTDPNYFTSITR